MRARWSLARVLLAGVLLSATSAMAAPQPFLAIRPASPAPISADPGTVLSAGLRIDGTGAAVAVLETLELPAGWESVLPLAPFVVPPDGTARLLAIQVPHGAAAGDYLIRYGLEGEGSGEPLGSVLLPVTITPRSALEFLVSEFPESLVAGTRVETPVLVRNRGNVPLDLRLSARLPDPGYTATLEPATITLAPGAAAQV
ncbi:MAG TPA: NEW3 domain-containing protein, partial [bacterium]|nr:NEW3 domain-containing protein [bacterium]